MKKLIIFIVSILIIVVSNLSYAIGEKKTTWSFHFNNDSIMNALEKVVFKTGVQINLNATVDDIFITNSFKDKTVHEVLTTVFRRLNCGVVWNYSKDQLTSVDVWIYDRIQGNDFSKVPLNRFLKRKHLVSKKNDTNNYHSITHSLSQKFDAKHSTKNERNPATDFFHDVRSKHYDAPPMPPAFFYQEIKNKNYQRQEGITSNTTHSTSDDNRLTPFKSSNSQQTPVTLMQSSNKQPPPVSSSSNKQLPVSSNGIHVQNEMNDQKSIIQSIEKPPPVPPGFNQ